MDPHETISFGSRIGVQIRTFIFTLYISLFEFLLTSFLLIQNNGILDVLSIFLFYLPMCSPAFSTSFGALSVQLSSVDSTQSSEPFVFWVGLPNGGNKSRSDRGRRLRLGHL